MDTNQTLNIIDKYFKRLELLGNVSYKELMMIIYLMFIDEYYEYYRGISLKDINNDEVGLTDCRVKNLNKAIECLKCNSDILKCSQLDYLPTKIHWIIPDDPYEDNDYINGTTFYTEGPIAQKVLSVIKHINNNILQL